MMTGTAKPIPTWPPGGPIAKLVIPIRLPLGFSGTTAAAFPTDCEILRPAGDIP